MMRTFHLLIKGRVQGVFFRATAQEIAKELGVTGWIRNTDEGDVEVMATGTDEAVQKFINWCRIGPRGAKVTDVIVSEREETSFEKFSVVR